MTFEKIISILYDGLDSGKIKHGENLNVESGFIFWRDALLEKVCRIFEWHGLPFEQKNIELATIINGFCGFTFDNGYNDYIAVVGGLSGVTPFPDVYTDFTYASPKCSGGTKPIYPYNDFGLVVIIDNTTCRNSLLPLIERYARLLAHSDATIRGALINARYNSYMIAENDSTRESMIEWRKSVEDGEIKPIVNKSLTTDTPIIPISDTNKGNLILQSIEARENILRMFYNDIGIRKNKDKRGNMVVDEVAQDDMSLLFNISDMLKQRKYACENINKLYGLNVSVKLSDEYNSLDAYDGDN